MTSRLHEHLFSHTADGSTGLATITAVTKLPLVLADIPLRYAANTCCLCRAEVAYPTFMGYRRLD